MPIPVEPSEVELAERYRLAEARALLKCYALAVGRAPRSVAEIQQWFVAHPEAVPRTEDGTFTPLS